MTHPNATRRALVAACAAALLTASASSALAGDAAPTTPTAPPIQLAPDLVGSLALPDDVKWYTDLGNIFQDRPMLGPAGTLDWFVSRQLSSDDPRAIGRAMAQPFVTPKLDFENVPGTVELRGTGYNSWGYEAASGAVSGTQAGAVGGRNWVIDHAATPRPARDVLRGLLDGGDQPTNLRFPKGFNAQLAIPTDRGIRALGGLTTKRGRRTAVAVTAPGGTRPVEQRKMGLGLVGAAARPDGGLMLVGQGSGSVADPIVLVDRRGRAKRVADRRDPSAAGFTGRAGVVAVRAGIVLDESSTSVSRNGAIDKSAVVLRDARTGKVRLRKYLRDLEFPQDPKCLAPTRQFHAISLAAGPDGQPVLTLACGNTREYTQTYGQHTYTYTDTFDDQAVMVGLRDDLSVRWWRSAPEVLTAPKVRQDYGCRARSITDRDARLLIISCDGTIRAVAVPGAAPGIGTLQRTVRAGDQAVLARIRCRAANGSVCSGRAVLTANGQVLGSADYALPARPAGAAGVLDRRITTTAPLPKRFSVSLAPRS